MFKNCSNSLLYLSNSGNYLSWHYIFGTVIKLEQNIRVKYMNTLLEFSFFFSIVADLNYTAIDAFLVLATPPSEFRKDIYKIEFPHVTGGIKMGCVTRLTRRVSLVEQELLTLPEHLSSPPVFSGARITRS
jgi:hypothetical protein